MERQTGEALLDALESGDVRVAERDSEGAWSVNAWVKEEILALFRNSFNVAMGSAFVRPVFPFVDKKPFTVREFHPAQKIRLVPGGSSVRRGSHVGRDTVLMPPCYVNVGAYIGEGSMVDSHALVGSCAQVGRRVHVSAGAQIGGVLEPPGSRPVIVEDDALVGGQSGLYEGVLVRRRAVIAAGCLLTATTKVYDLVRGERLSGTPEAPLEIPEGAVVVPGTRPAEGPYAKEHGLAATCGLITKYRDERTDARTALEQALR